MNCVSPQIRSSSRCFFFSTALSPRGVPKRVPLFTGLGTPHEATRPHPARHHGKSPCALSLMDCSRVLTGASPLSEGPRRLSGSLYLKKTLDVIKFH